MTKKNTKKDLNEKQMRKKVLEILDKKKKQERKANIEDQKIKEEAKNIIDKYGKKQKPKFDISINVSKNSKAREKLAEKGIKINLGGLLDSIFSKKNIEKGTGKVLKTADKMLKEDINDYSEFGSKEKNGVKVEHGFRMRFLDKELKDDDKEEKDYENEKLKKWKKK
jgi:hypothetical protein